MQTQVLLQVPLQELHKQLPHKHMKFVPDPDNTESLKYDTSGWRPDPENPGETKYNNDPDFLTDYQKLLVEESQKRKEILLNSRY
jgi:hypothetical protein